MRRRLLTVWIAASAFASGCAHDLSELERLRIENELLREEIAVVRRNCEHYGGLQIEVEEEPDEGAP